MIEAANKPSTNGKYPRPPLPLGVALGDPIESSLFEAIDIINNLYRNITAERVYGIHYGSGSVLPDPQHCATQVLNNARCYLISYFYTGRGVMAGRVRT